MQILLQVKQCIQLINLVLTVTTTINNTNQQQDVHTHHRLHKEKASISYNMDKENVIS